MRHFILTGTPGAGKTTLLRLLELAGHAVVEEAATDVIALRQALGGPEPWTEPGFIDEVAALQRRRQIRATASAEEPVVFDRSPVCTLALARFLGRPPSRLLMEEIARIGREGFYDRRVLFLDNLGRVQPTAARTISFEDALRFEAMHADAYRELGFDCVRIAAGPLQVRFEAAAGLLRDWSR